MGAGFVCSLTPGQQQNPHLKFVTVLIAMSQLIPHGDMSVRACVSAQRQNQPNDHGADSDLP